MKTLLLLRHGKSNWDADFDYDHGRPLAKRGRRAAKRMGRFLAEAGLVPDVAVTSTAERAASTLELARAAGGWEHVPVRRTDALYEASRADVLELVRGMEEEVETLLLVGHEPTWSELASALIGGGSVRVPTGALVQLEVQAPRWRDAGFGLGRLRMLLPPRQLG